MKDSSTKLQGKAQQTPFAPESKMQMAAQKKARTEFEKFTSDYSDGSQAAERTLGTCLPRN